MKIKVLLKVLILFILLLFLQFILSFSLVKFFNIKKDLASEIVFLSIDISFVLIIALAIRILKIKVLKLFKIIYFKEILYLMFIGLLITIIFPVFTENFVDNISTNKYTMMKPDLYFFENQNFFVSKYYFLLKTLILMPILEEIFYRGLIFNELKKHFSIIWSILISSLFFTIGHMDIEQFFSLFLSGIILGIIYYRSENILSPILLHFFVNVSVLFLSLKNTENPGILVFIYYSIILVTIIILLRRFPKRRSPE